jgi:tripartite-type tricarboxylate transporter receptor subunit TctC
MSSRSRPHAACCTLIGAVLGCSAAFPAMPADEAAGYPARPIRVVVGFTPGGQPDITARLIGPKLYEALGQQVVVDNRPGAGGTVGTKIVADANPDGYTLISVSASHVIAPSIYTKLPYDTVKDFAGITTTAIACYVLAVPPSLGVKSVQELIALAKAKPGQLNFASAGQGSGTHFAAELFKSRANVDVTHVPYKGIPEALTDTIGGRVQFFMAPLGASVNLIKDGKLRALGVSSKQRVRIHPDIPTLAESGLPGFQWDSWAAWFAPARTPRAIITRLNREIGRVLALPEVQQRLTAIGMEPTASTPAQLDKLVVDELAVVADLARKAGLKAQ